MIAGTLLLAVGAAVCLWANAARTGYPFQTAYQAYWAYAGYGPFPTGFEHSVRVLTDSLIHLGFWLHGWPVSLVFLPFFRRTSLAIRLAASCALVALANGASAVPTVAHVGPVYYGELILQLCILEATGIESVVSWIRTRAEDRWAGAVAAAPLVMILVSLVTLTPVQLYWLERMSTNSNIPYALVEQRELKHAVVFMDNMPAAKLFPGTWAFFHRNPDPDLRDPVLFVRNTGPEGNARLLAYLKDRDGWRLVRREERFELVPIPR
jgi:hypothetical protein